MLDIGVDDKDTGDLLLVGCWHRKQYPLRFTQGIEGISGMFFYPNEFAGRNFFYSPGSEGKNFSIDPSVRFVEGNYSIVTSRGKERPESLLSYAKISNPRNARRMQLEKIIRELLNLPEEVKI